ncbi:MAG: sulfite reductase subunit A [Deltaproteobacteria bacterium]|nr:MAG: sulfite reductase subunit A [Deltaproteobacteria bacterium]
MPPTFANLGDEAVLDIQGLRQLLEVLGNEGYRVLGPTLRHGSLVYDHLPSIDALPRGWGDEQQGGFFRLRPLQEPRFFGYGVGQQSWKQFLYPPRRRLWQARLQPDGLQILPVDEDAPKFAFIGVRACDLQAIAVQDRVFLEGPFIDPHYRARREQAFILAVNCGHACGTGFCASMGAGPKAASGFDLALTEILEGDRHYFVAAVGTERGRQVVSQIPHRKAEAAEQEAAARTTAQAAREMGRTLDTGDIKALLYRNYENPQWDRVAARCLTCGNCTLVCPTCFCHTVEDSSGLTGEQAERRRRWDVCFTVDYSYLHGGSVRATPRSRYRQWLTHKLATWIDQFGVSGCVGCGRCITWCPVAIDITEEVRAIRESEESGVRGQGLVTKQKTENDKRE